jgi:hypothetical protein
VKARTLALAVFCLSLPFSAVSEFRFQIPAEFRDLSPGAPPANFDGVPEAIVTESRSGKYVVLAMDFRYEDGFYENFNASVTKGALEVEPGSIEEHSSKLAAEYGKAFGSPVTVLEKDVTSVGGVPSFRIVYDVVIPGQLTMRQMQYFVPGEREFAILTYSATPETFAQYRPAFEASALATQGAAAPKLVDWWRAGRAGLIGAVVAGVVGFFYQLLKSRQAPKRPPMRRMPPRPGPRR